MREREKEFVERNVKIAVVTFEYGGFARSYVEETGLAWPLLVDATREAYRAYGMLSASFRDVFGPRTWWAYLKEFAKGQRPQKTTGDIYQRGGDVLIDPDGMVVLHHVGDGPADRPAVETILAKVRASEG